MKPSVYGQVRKIMKAQFRGFGQLPTQETMIEMVEGNRETIKRAYRASLVEIREEERIMNDLYKLVGSNREKLRLEIIIVIGASMAFGFLLGVLLITL